MLPEEIGNRLTDFKNKWPWIYLAFFAVLAIGFFVFEYRSRRLQQKLVSLQILDLISKNPKLNSTDSVNDALNGDRINEVLETVSFGNV